MPAPMIQPMPRPIRETGPRALLSLRSSVPATMAWMDFRAVYRLIDIPCAILLGRFEAGVGVTRAARLTGGHPPSCSIKACHNPGSLRHFEPIRLQAADGF